MRSVFTILFTTWVFVGSSQTVHRTFLPVNPRVEKVKLLANEKSTFLIKTTADQSMEVIAFDDELKESWGIGIVLKFPVLHVAEAYEDVLALLLSDAKRRNFVLLEIDAGTGHYFFSEYKISTSFQGEQLARHQEVFWVKGWIGDEPVAFRLEGASKTFKTLPVGNAAPIKSIKHFAYDPENQELDMLLETHESGNKAFILRSINLKGDITRNLLLSHPNRHVADLWFHKLESRGLQAVGTLSKKKLVSGLVLFTKSGTGISLKEWEFKSLKGFDRNLSMENGELVQRGDKGIKSMEAVIDEVSFSPGGELMVALETYEKDYEVRGLLQRESDEQSMVDQIDLNRYGRRGFDTNETTLNDRVDNFSNTEAAAYRFREVIIDRVQEQGNRHSQTTIIKIDEMGESGMQLKLPKSVNSTFSITDRNMARDFYWVADDQGLKKLSLSENTTLVNHNLSLGPYLKRIGPSEFLNFGFLMNDKVFYLLIQRIGFDDSSN